MEIKENKLYITRDELFKMINEDNPDKNDFLKDKLLNIVNNFEHFSEKQYNWILSKMKYITNHNSKYEEIKNNFISFELEE